MHRPLYESGIARVEAHVDLGRHRGIWLADQKRSVVIVGQGRRPNRDWYAQPMLACAATPPSRYAVFT